MQTTKKSTRPLAETTAAAIIQLIKDHKMLPGDQLATEYELAEQLSVGRSTIREAFKLLTSRNILEIRQGAGTFISAKRGIPDDPLGLTFIYDDDSLALDLLDVRLIFEPEMAVLAAINASNAQCRKIEEQCQKVEAIIAQNGDYGHEDIELHRLIAEASGNKVIGNLGPIIHSSVEKSINITTNALKEHTLTYHRKIVDAIKAGDTQSARYSMITHLNINREYIIQKQKKPRPI